MGAALSEFCCGPQPPSKRHSTAAGPSSYHQRALDDTTEYHSHSLQKSNTSQGHRTPVNLDRVRDVFRIFKVNFDLDAAATFIHAIRINSGSKPLLIGTNMGLVSILISFLYKCHCTVGVLSLHEKTLCNQILHRIEMGSYVQIHLVAPSALQTGLCEMNVDNAVSRSSHIVILNARIPESWNDTLRTQILPSLTYDTQVVTNLQPFSPEWSSKSNVLYNNQELHQFVYSQPSEEY